MVQSIRVSADENGKIDSATLKTEINTVLSGHEIEVDDAAIELVADGLSETFTPEELQNMSTTELVDKVVERFGSAEVLAYLQDVSNGATDEEQEGEQTPGGEEPGDELPDEIPEDILDQLPDDLPEDWLDQLPDGVLGDLFG